MTRPPLPPLAAVRCFEAAARHRGFSRAAEELGMTQAAVSYQIKLIEERLGVALFLRGPRGVTLTDAGRRLAPAVTSAFAGLRAAFEDLSDAVDGILTISVVSTFASNWLVPRLGAFQRAFPGISVRLDVAAEIIDFARSEVDAGIRSGDGRWPGLVCHRLMPVHMTPMLSPRLIEREGPVATPADLLRLPLIDPGDPWWTDWFTAAGLAPPDLSQRTEMRLVTQHLAARAALAGHGVAILSPAFHEEELARGDLVQPFGLVHAAGSSYWLVYPEARRRSARIRAFRDWLAGETAADAEGRSGAAGGAGRDAGLKP